MGWSTDPLAPEAPEVCCTDGTCDTCQVKAAGARRMGAWVGFDYDALDPNVQLHYREICGAVMSAMSEAMILSGHAVPKETP